MMRSFRALRGVNSTIQQRAMSSQSGARSLLKISDFSRAEIASTLSLAASVKAEPEKYSDAMKQKTLLMLFQKPSLRTRISFETLMTQTGGHAIYYATESGPMGAKESLSDTAQVISRYVDVVMARLNDRSDIQELAKHATVPVINALDDYAHPTQMLADMQTIIEQKGSLEGLKLAFAGDICNNVTYDLMRMGCVMGMEVRVAGPSGEGYDVEASVIEECNALAAANGSPPCIITQDVREACDGVDVVYCDSWMSYGISKEEEAARIAKFMPYQVNEEVMSITAPDSIFMNCLPAARGMEQTAAVIDGPKSVVFDEAENRLHAQKALVLKLFHGMDYH